MKSLEGDSPADRASAAGMASAVKAALKDTLKTTLRPIAHAARPAAESFSRHSARGSISRQNIQLRWFDQWNPTLDQALGELPPPDCCTRDQYRTLLQPTGVPKRHILATRKDEVAAVVSLRKRATLWEPVAYQSITDFIAPCLNPIVLGVILNALGLEISLTGIGEWVHSLMAQEVYKFGIPEVQLQGDFAAFWNVKRNGHKHIYTIRNARRKCERFEVAYDQEGDLDWVINRWTEMWKDDPHNEIVIREDRRAFFKSLNRAPSSDKEMTYHTVTLRDGGKIVAGVILSRIGGHLIYQATAREDAYARDAVGVGALDKAIQWAASKGWASFDLGGTDDFKRDWAPAGVERHGVTFRPKMIGALNRIVR